MSRDRKPGMSGLQWSKIISLAVMLWLLIIGLARLIWQLS